MPVELLLHDNKSNDNILEYCRKDLKWYQLIALLHRLCSQLWFVTTEQTWRNRLLEKGVLAPPYF
jgi:hypothetical protein